MIINLFSNTSWSLLNFRKDFIKELIKKNIKLLLLAIRINLQKINKVMYLKNTDTLEKLFERDIMFIQIIFHVLNSRSDLFINFTINLAFILDL